MCARSWQCCTIQRYLLTLQSHDQGTYFHPSIIYQLLRVISYIPAIHRIIRFTHLPHGPVPACQKENSTWLWTADVPTPVHHAFTSHTSTRSGAEEPSVASATSLLVGHLQTHTRQSHPSTLIYTDTLVRLGLFTYPHRTAQHIRPKGRLRISHCGNIFIISRWK